MANSAQVSERTQQQLTGGRKELQVKDPVQESEQAPVRKSEQAPAREPVREPIPERSLELKKMRAPRSRKYIKAIEQSAPLTETGEEMKSAVESLPAPKKLLGILSECGIPGCVIHAIDKWGNILRHYKTLEEIPPELREGYEVWEKHSGCICVEVYTFTICIIYDDGTVKIAEREL
ncbi:MAG: hypothetical protein NC517_09055 [Firmicutes bacterium]|nr:hypothetical protein [Bacillota bacterium]